MPYKIIIHESHKGRHKTKILQTNGQQTNPVHHIQHPQGLLIHMLYVHFDNQT